MCDRQSWRAFKLGTLLVLLPALAAVATHLCGCVTRIPAEIVAEISPEVATAIGVAVDQSREDSHDQIKNQLWPIVAMQGVDQVVGLLKFATLAVVVWFVVRRYSYRRQKPEYEEEQQRAIRCGIKAKAREDRRKQLFEACNPDQPETADG